MHVVIRPTVFILIYERDKVCNVMLFVCCTIGCFYIFSAVILLKNMTVNCLVDRRILYFPLWVFPGQRPSDYNVLNKGKVPEYIQTMFCLLPSCVMQHVPWVFKCLIWSLKLLSQFAPLSYINRKAQ